MEHTIDLTAQRPVTVCDLGERFSGDSKDGRSISFTNYAMQMNGRNAFIISGEMHYCRVSPDQWEDTILKMKQGGIDAIASYVFWNIHEEREGVFRFDGCRDLRRFLQLCARHHMMVILRIGPFAHGEMRNGGLPDWLYGKPFEVRNNNEGYLACVRRFYAAIHSQVEGLYFSEGGPVVGIQIENEYMHSSAPWEITTGAAGEWVNGGQDGNAHMLTLKQLACDIGLRVPFYTGTAWGGAMVPEDEILPLWGGYAYWPWIFYNRTGEHPCTPEYIYRDNHNNAIPSTYNFVPRYAPETRPYACCEMMGGMMCSYNYRFTLPYPSVDALANIKLGSGCTMLGYYMYRGGTTPLGETAPFMNEGQISKRSYDYQAPIGEYGQLRPSYARLRTLHDFCHTFADQLIETQTWLPDEPNDMQPEDTQSLRWAVRMKDNAGFVFINNFQDHLEMPDRHDELLRLTLPGESIAIGPIDLAGGENAVLPFNLPMDGALLKWATAQPITRLVLEDEACWFFCMPDGMTPVLAMQGVESVQGCETERKDDLLLCLAAADTVLHVSTVQGSFRIVLMSRAVSMRFTHINCHGQNIAILSDAGVIWDGDTLRLESDGAACELMTMPPHVLQTDAMDAEKISMLGFAGVLLTRRAADQHVTWQQVGTGRYTINVPQQVLTGHKTVLLRVNYMGNIGQAFINGVMVSDQFCNGQPWDIRLDDWREELAQHPLTIYIVPIKKGASVSVDSTMAARMERVDQAIASLDGAELVTIDDIMIPFAD